MASKSAKTKSIKERYASGEQKSRHAMEEFGPGKRGFIFCPRGEAVYYKKSWHHMGEFFNNPPNLKGDENIRFKLCPAHEMEKNKQYEGEVVIKNIPAKFRKELINLIENMGEHAIRRDVLDRVLELRSKKQELRITTSENQLAQKIAQKISEVFKKKVNIKISRMKEGDMLCVHVVFKS